MAKNYLNELKESNPAEYEKYLSVFNQLLIESKDMFLYKSADEIESVLNEAHEAYLKENSLSDGDVDSKHHIKTNLIKITRLLYSLNKD